MVRAITASICYVVIDIGLYVLWRAGLVGPCFGSDRIAVWPRAAFVDVAPLALPVFGLRAFLGRRFDAKI